jgi:hypothetical protein
VVLGSPALENRCAQGAPGQGQAMTHRIINSRHAFRRRRPVVAAMS